MALLVYVCPSPISLLFMTLTILYHSQLFLPGYQVERPMSELFLTLVAQRYGIDVWHGHQADLQETVLSSNGSTVSLKEVGTGKKLTTKSSLVVDGTGRFRQVSSKYSRVKRFDGWNTDAFWAYFLCRDEAPLAQVRIAGPECRRMLKHCYFRSSNTTKWRTRTTCASQKDGFGSFVSPAGKGLLSPI